MIDRFAAMVLLCCIELAVFARAFLQNQCHELASDQLAMKNFHSIQNASNELAHTSASHNWWLALTTHISELLLGSL